MRPRPVFLTFHCLHPVPGLLGRPASAQAGSREWPPAGCEALSLLQPLGWGWPVNCQHRCRGPRRGHSPMRVLTVAIPGSRNVVVVWRGGLRSQRGEARAEARLSGDATSQGREQVASTALTRTLLDVCTAGAVTPRLRLEGMKANCDTAPKEASWAHSPLAAWRRQL